MFETLFGFNTKTQQYVDCIGTDFGWMNGGTKLHIKINPDAKWSDGTNITATDVVKSYELAALQNQWSKDFPLRFDNFTVANSTGVIFYMNDDYHFSRRALDWISTNIPIVPWSIYRWINATYADVDTGALDTFLNDWWDPNFNASWKICSGPYAPVYRDAAKTTAVYQRRTDWWGNSTTVQLYSDIPNWNKGEHPTYIGHRTNLDKDAAFRAGQVDWHGGYYEELWKDFDKNAFLDYAASWYNRSAPYEAALASPLNVAFNHEDPFHPELAQPWFRHALSYMINYNPIPAAAASGYTRRGMPNMLDNTSTVQKVYFNETLKNQYWFDYNLTEAYKILKANDCWMTNTTWVKGTPPTWAFGAAYDNRTFGPYSMICPAGWTDVRIFTEYVCNDFQAAGVPVYYEAIDTDATGGWSIWSSRWTNRFYTLGMSVGEPKVLETPEVFFNGWRAFKDWNNNITGWHSAAAFEFNDLYLQLESEADPDRYQYLLDQIQEIFCKEIPEIPCFVNGYWYAFSEYYWKGFTSIDNEYQQLITIWTNNAIPMKTRMVLNLVSTHRAAVSVGGGIPWTGLEIFMILGLVSTIILAGNKVYRKRR